MPYHLAFLGSIGPWEIFLIVALIIVIFGARKLPELGRGLGEGLRNFRKGIKEISDDGEANKHPDTEGADGAKRAD